MSATPPTRADVETRLANAQADILGLGVRRLALFGSVRRDAARLDSDVDVLVEFQPAQKSFDRFMALGDLLERLLGRKVELVTPESLSPFLKPHILADAVDVIRAA
jgi:predicted nucleotidyltransferase